MKNNLLISFILCTSMLIHAQTEKEYRNTTNALTINMSYGSNVSMGDLKDRFGSSFAMGMDLEWVTAQRSWIYGFKSRYGFGRNVKENVLSNLIGAEGMILGVDQGFASIFLRQRGFYLGADFGKIFSFGLNKKSGLRVTVGVGYMAHWVRIQDDTQSVVQIRGLYKAGYDRLTGGFSLTQFIGYQHLALNGRMNLFGGIELYQGFTKSLRSVDYSTQLVDTRSRTDILAGVRVGVILPFYFGGTEQDQEIFY